MLADGQQKLLAAEIEQVDWSIGAGGKLKQFLMRGVGIHHAGLLPKYRRIIEKLFQKKLLSICVCTETLAAGINLPARSVVMTSLLKGPPRAMKLIEASSAHQMFGRAGRPQFDTRGYVFAVAHEDDVRMFRWQQKYDEIPEDSKDPMLLRAKKNLKKKMPRRRDGQQYWTERQFQTLREAPAAKLASRGRFPWRLLAYFIRKSGMVMTLQDAVRRRLLDSAEKDDAEKQLVRMLITLEAGGFITLDPPPPKSSASLISGTTTGGPVFHSVRAGDVTSELLTAFTTATVSVRDSRWVSSHLAPMVEEVSAIGEVGGVIHFDATEPPEDFGDDVAGDDAPDSEEADAPTAIESPDDSANQAALVKDEPSESADPPHVGLLGKMIQEARKEGSAATGHASKPSKREPKPPSAEEVMLSEYSPRLAIATEQMSLLLPFRSINSIYGVFLAEQMHKANYEERLQLLESALDLPSSVASQVRVPSPEMMPDGSLSTDYLNPLLLSRGIVTQQEITGYYDEVNRRRIYPLPLGDRMRMLFHSEYPGISDVYVRSVWCIGDLLRFGGNFDRYVRARELTKQEGIMFRHCLRMILLCGEFAQLEPPGLDPAEWRHDLAELASILTESCRAVDPSSTDEIITTLKNQAEGLDHL